MESLDRLHQVVLLLPVITTICSAFFVWQLFNRYKEKGGGAHLLWWGIGMITYGLGTATEAYTSIFGWNAAVFRAWYIVGAFLGGYPLAQGTVFLLMSKTFARRSAWIASSFIALASIFVLMTPLDTSLAEAHRLSGKVIVWQQVRLISPFINLYSVLFLVGGAIVSALRFRSHPSLRHRYLGNIWIAVGAILPGIGGSLTRAGYVEALYITELVGLLCIYRGYRLNIAGQPAARTAAPAGATLMKTSTTMLALLLGASLLLAPPLAAAPQEGDASSPPADDTSAAPEESPDEPAESFFATTTVTAKGYEVDTFEISNPVNILSAEEIEIAAPQNAADLLRTEPGVDVDGIGPNQSRPIIRGQRGLRVLFLENGLRMNNPRRQTDFGEVPGLVDIDSVATMEVVRGPSSVLYGSDAIGGVLNLITLNPVRGEGVKGSASLRSDSAADSWQAGGNLGGSSENLAYRVGFSARSFEDYSAPSGTFGEIRLDDSAPVVDSGVDDDTLWGTLAIGLADSQDLRLRINRYRAEDSGFGFVEPELLGGGDDFRIRILYPFQDFDRFTAAYTGSNYQASWIDSLDAKLYHQNNERQLVNDIDINIGPLFPGAPNSFVFADTQNFTDIESTGLRLEAIKSIGDRHLITYGIDAYEDTSRNTDASVTTTQLNFPFPPFTVESVSEDTVANAPNATNSSLGAFVQGDFALGDRWKVALGARNQTVSTKADATPGWDVSGLDFDDEATVASASALYRATDNVHLVASYGTAFRAPNIIERLFNGLTPEGAGFQILNPNLVSEDSETVDVGLKYRRKQALFELNYFRNDIDDGIIQYFLSPAEIAQLPQATQDVIETSGVSFVVQQRNIDRLRYEGVELLVRYRLGDAWTLGGNFTYLDGERVDSTNPPTGDTFGEKVNLSARYQPSQGRWWAEYRVRHNGEDKANLDPGEPVPPVGAVLPDFTVHTLAGGVVLHDGQRSSHELALTVDNVTDELYAEFSNATFFRPQPERRAIATYRLRF